MPSRDVMDRARGLLVAIAAAVTLAGCDEARTSYADLVATGGDPERGAAVLSAFGCGACHRIPGVDGANGVVGPPLTEFGRRAYIAGALPNAPENLVSWIMDPQSIERGTAMPNLGVPEPQARDMAAYLYTLH